MRFRSETQKSMDIVTENGLKYGEVYIFNFTNKKNVNSSNDVTIRSMFSIAFGNSSIYTNNTSMSALTNVARDWYQSND